MGDDHISDLGVAGTLEPNKTPSSFWKKIFTIPNAVFAVSIILILIYFVTMPRAQPSLNANVIDTPAVNVPKLLEVYYFYDSKDCSSCIEGKAFLEGLRKKHLEVNLRLYEMSYDLDNKRVYEKFLSEYHVDKPFVVPITFVDGKYFKGFTTGTGAEIEAYVESLISPKTQ